MNVKAYVRRINCAAPKEANFESLKGLHRSHLYAVPFENLDIPLGREISLSLPAIFRKVVNRRRGGFCYELNGLFAWLLARIGFQVEMLSAQVFGPDGPGPEFDHMTLLVDVGAPVIADVGFGDSFVEPLPLDGQARFQHGYWYRFRQRRERWLLERREGESAWEPQYIFSLKPRRLVAFEPMCRYQQTSPDSPFTRKSVCSKATPEGRITISDGRLIVTGPAGRRERRIGSEDEQRELLKTHFGIELGPDAEIGRLLATGSG